MAPKIKLTYFPIEAAGEPIRLALILSETEFEDVKVPIDDWPSFKPTTPFGLLPLLNIDDGPTRTQSKAMLRWVGANCSSTLYPTDKLFDIEEAIGIIEDFQASWRPALNPQKIGFPDGFYATEEGIKVKEQIRAQWVEEQLPKFLKFFVTLLERNDGKWIASKEGPTIADCLLVPALRNFTRGHVDYVPTSCLEIEPSIVDYIKRFCALEPIQGRYTNGGYL